MRETRVLCYSFFLELVFSILWGYQSRNRERKISVFENGIIVYNCFFVSRQVVTNQCCGLAVIFCGFISHLIGRETINIPESFSGVHGFTGKTVTSFGHGAQFFGGYYSRDVWTAEATFSKLPGKCRNVTVHVFCTLSHLFVRPGFRLFCAGLAVHYLAVSFISFSLFYIFCFGKGLSR